MQKSVPNDSYAKLITALGRLPHLCPAAAMASAVAALAYAIHFISFADIHRIVSVVPDDASYYFNIARNLSSGRGLTFDYVTTTNGFHPLWLAILAAVNFFVQAEPERLIRIYLLLQLAISASSGWMLYAIVAHRYSRATGLFVCLAFILWIVPATVNGMESAVLLFAVVGFFSAYLKNPPDARINKAAAFRTGIWLGLVVLARLDSIFLAFVVFSDELYHLGRKPRGPQLTRLLLIAQAFLLLLVPYLGYNGHAFGHFVPVSGWVKSSFPELGWQPGFLNDPVLATLVLVSIGYLLWLAAASRKTGTAVPPYRRCLAFLSATILLQTAYMALFLKAGGIWQWYFTLFYLLIPMLIAEPVHCLLGAMSQRINYGLLGMLVIAIGLLPNTVRATRVHALLSPGKDVDWQVASYDAAVWARQNTNETAKFAMSDAGHFAFFSQRSVINLDGLVNDFAYQEVLAERRLNAYLRSRGIDYVAHHAVYNNQDVVTGDYDTYTKSYRSFRYENESDGVALRKVNEAFRSAPYIDASIYRTVFLIWRY